jgi:hypothetical protein
MTCSSLTPIYLLDIFDNFPGGQDSLVAWFWWGVTLVTLVHKTTTTRRDLLLKPGEDHDLFKSHSFIFVGYF